MGSIGGPGILEQQQAQLQQRPQGGTPPAGVGPISEIFRQQLQARTQPAAQQQRTIPIDADMQSGVPANVRSGVSAGVHPKSRVAYLEETYGKGNVWSLTDDAKPEDLFVRTWMPVSDDTVAQLSQFLPDDAFRPSKENPDGFDALRWVQVDPQGGGFDPLEPLDFAADVLQGGPGVVGGKIGAGLGSALGPGGTAVGAGVGTVVGELVGSVGRQGVSAALAGGNEDLSLGERATITASDVAGGVIGEAGGRLVKAGIEKFRPHNILAESLNAGAYKAYAIEGRELAKRVGLTAGQITGAPATLRFESMLRQTQGGGDYFFNEDVKRLTQLGGMLEDELKELGGEISKEGAGEKVGALVNTYYEGIRKARSKAARVLFGRVSALSGDERIISIRNFVNKLDELEERFSTGTSKSASSAEAIVEKVKKTRRELYEERNIDPQTKRILGVKITASELQNDLSNWGDLAAGTGQFVKDLDKAQDISISKELFNAMKRDLDEAAEKTDLNANVRDALMKARRGYAVMSGVLDGARSRVMKDIFKLTDEAAPDAIAKKLANGWTDVQVREAMRVLEKVDKRTAMAARASALKQMIEESAPGSEPMSGRGVLVSPNKLATILNKKSDRLDALFFKSAARGRLETIRKTAGRLAATANTGPGNSQTASMLWLRRVVKDLSVGGVINPKAAIGQIANLMTEERLAKALADAEGQRVVLDILRLSEGTGNVFKVLGRLAAYNGMEEALPARGEAPKPVTREDIAERTMRFAPGGI